MLGLTGIVIGVIIGIGVATGQECTVSIRNGTVIGKTVGTLVASKKVCSYTNIPFATPPLGALRFANPVPSQGWGASPLNATTIPNMCPQLSTPPAGAKISEDCLYLNVYTPRGSTPTSNLPVMVWIHGGGFTGGSSHIYTAFRLLAKADLILVVVQYRLGALGFLSTADAQSPGNYGLKDQAMSIRWVNENIGAFGGNPKRVTVFGESAGGASAIYQLVTPLNKGLVHGIIAQSGSALGHWALDRKPLQTATGVAAKLGCPITSTAAAVACLRLANWENIVKVQGTSIPPAVEPNLPGAFITQEPMEIMKSGEIPNIPVMLGATKHDGSMFLQQAYGAVLGPLKLDKNPDYMRNQIVPDILKFFMIYEDPANRAVASSVEMAYLGGVNRSSWDESMPGLVDIYSVFAFKSAAMHTADLLSKRGLSVYLYSFEHHSNLTFFSKQGMPIEGGIAHVDDLIYLFHVIPFNSVDQSFSDMFINMWLNFGSVGNPTPSTSSQYDNWVTYNTGEEAYMKLNATPKILYGYRYSWRPNGFQWN